MAGKKNKENEQYNVVDLFAGVGGIALGFENQGFQTILANDIDENASKTFRKNFPHVNFIEGDISKVSSTKIKSAIDNKKVHVLVGGIPCQSFSLSGNRIRKGIDNSTDPRHFLYKEFFRILDIVKSDIAIIENVKGIKSSHGGEILENILESFRQRNYSVNYQVLNASEHGVPQARERVFIIANKIKQKNIFPQKENFITPITKALTDIPNNVQNHEKRFLTGKTLERVKLIKPGENWTILPKKLQTKSIHSGAYGRIDPTKPSRTLTTRFDTPSVGYVTHPTENRTLTVREGARIQTFPDDFIFLGNRMSQYKQVGNAVPVKLAESVSKGIKDMLNSFYENQ